MNTKPITVLSIALGLALSMNACTESSSSSDSHAHGDDTHTHAEESHAADDMHESIPLGTMMVNDFTIELTQGHGKVHAGEEEHLIVKLQDSESKILSVRAWIGTEDKTQSFVGKGEFSRDRNVYDVHMSAPESLDPDSKWWIELEMKDGTISTGSMKAIQ